MKYPINLEVDDNETWLVTSPDFAELTTFGDDRDEAVARAVGAFEEVIAARMHDRENIPPPSTGEVFVALPTLTAVDVLPRRGR